MKVPQCEREQEVLEAVLEGRWPEAVERELAGHVARCPVCSDVVLVARFIGQDRGAALAEAVVPSAGLVWWKAQLQARREAAQRVAEPILVAEAGAAVTGILTLIGLIVWQWTRLSAWIGGLGRGWASSALAGAAGLESHGVLVVTASALLLMMSFLIYEALKE